MGLTPAPLPTDDNKGPMLLGVYWGIFPLTLVIIGARIYARAVTHRLDWDDWFMLAAWLVYLALLIISTIIANEGGGRHTAYIGPDEAVVIAKLTVISQPFAIIGNSLAKTSIAILFHRILIPGWSVQKWLLWGTTAIFWSLCIVASVMAFVQCLPPPTPASLNPAGRNCVPATVSETINVVQGSWGVFQDFFLATFPLSVLWKLQMSLRQKLGLAVLLGLGVFSGACAIIKTTTLTTLIGNPDITWADSETFLWASVESAIYIICGSVPSIKPLWDRFVHKKPLQPYGKTFGHTESPKSLQIGPIYNSNQHGRATVLSECDTTPGESRRKAPGSADIQYSSQWSVDYGPTQI